MERAAQLRAKGLEWQDVADELDLAEGTVASYPSKYPPFEVDGPNRQGLVGWYREQLWSEEVDRLVRELQPEALRGLEEVLEAREKAGTEVGPSFSAVVSAARVVITSTGLEERLTLEAREDVQGTPGERVEVSGPDGGPIQKERVDDGPEPDDEAVLEAIQMLDDGDDDTSGD